MLFKKLTGVLRGKETGPEQVPATGAPRPSGDDGWIALENGRLVAHDPMGNGRFPSLVAEGGVRVLVGGAAVEELTVVTGEDQLHWELCSDPGEYFRLEVAPDAMSVTLTLTADPVRLPDTITVEGQHPARIRPAASAAARPRPGSPGGTVRAALAELGVVYGLDDALLSSELERPSYRPVVIARGQMPTPANPGQWSWSLDALGLVQPGQVIGVCRGSHPAAPRIDVRGQQEELSVPDAPPGTFAAGSGVRLVSGGRMVSLIAGRARTVQDGSGWRVEVSPASVVEGDLTQDMTVEQDLVVKGSVRGAKVRAGGEILVTVDASRCELTAGSVIVRGELAQSIVQTSVPGSWTPLRAEVIYLDRRLQELAELLEADKPVKEQALRELYLFIQATRAKAAEIGVDSPAFSGPLAQMVREFSKPDGVVPTAGRVAMLRRLLQELAALAGIEPPAGDVHVGTVAHSRIWAGRNVEVREKVQGGSIYCAGIFRTPPEAMLSQSEAVAGGGIKVGRLLTLRATSQVSLRSHAIEASEAEAGCAFDFGAEHKELKVGLVNLSATVTSRGQFALRQS